MSLQVASMVISATPLRIEMTYTGRIPTGSGSDQLIDPVDSKISPSGVISGNPVNVYTITDPYNKVIVITIPDGGTVYSITDVSLDVTYFPYAQVQTFRIENNQSKTTTNVIITMTSDDEQSPKRQLSATLCPQSINYLDNFYSDDLKAYTNVSDARQDCGIRATELDVDKVLKTSAFQPLGQYKMDQSTTNYDRR